MSAAAAHDSLQPRPPGGLLPGAGLSLLVHAGLVVAIALGVSWQRSAHVEFSAELWSALPEVAAPRSPAPEPAPPTPAATPAPPPPAAAPSPAAADIALERERKAAREKAEREAQLKKEREAAAQRQKDAEAAALKRQRELQQQRAEELAQQARDKAEAERLEKQRQDNLKRLLAQAGGGSGGPTSTGAAARDAAPSNAYGGLLIRHVKSKLVMPDIDRLPPTLEAVVEVRATATGTVLSRRLVKKSGNEAWDNAVLRAIEAASPLPRDTDGRVPTQIEITFRPAD